MNKKLSLLICSLENRQNKLQRLMSRLKSQNLDGVEILTETDNGNMPIGQKRNILLKKATGEYVAFIDDDDLVSEDYISKIFDALKSNPDCCGLEGTITTNGLNPKKFIHSFQYKSWFEKDGIYYRCPNHLNTVKRELAIQVGFPQSNFGEDRDYSTRLLPLLKNEVYISGVIYYYLYEKPASKPNIQERKRIATSNYKFRQKDGRR